jgi:hypothetical protein
MPGGVGYRLRQIIPANWSIVIIFRENQRRQTTLTAGRALGTLGGDLFSIAQPSELARPRNAAFDKKIRQKQL